MIGYRGMKAGEFLLVALMGVFCTGCQIHRVFYSPADPPVSQSWFERDVILAGDFIQERPATTPPDAKKKPTPPEGEGEAEPPADEPATEEEGPDEDSKPPYTVPGARFQQFALVAAGIAAFGVSDGSGAGREVAESGSGPAIVGRPGLSAPPQRINSAVVGRPGLQQGFAAGLGSAGDRNIFTATANPLSGANGRCQDLVNAGFFNRDRAACEASFHP